MVSVRCFGERWEDGREIRHQVETKLYWRRKLLREITRSVAIRDRRALAALVHFSALLRDPNCESINTSHSMVSLVAGTASMSPDDESLVSIWTEYLSKLPKQKKNETCRAILDDVCGTLHYKRMMKRGIAALGGRARQGPGSSEFTLHTVSELRMCRNMCENENEEAPGHVIAALVKADPAGHFPPGKLAESVSVSDWKMLVNRIDKMPEDAESWASIDALMASDAWNDDMMGAMRRYVCGYWGKFHGRVRFECEYRTRVMELLELAPE